MRAADAPRSESLRQQAVDDLDLDVLGFDSIFERYARIVCQALKTPIGALTIVSHQRVLLKAAVGIDSYGIGRAESFCAHAILGSAPMVVHDTYLDERFRDNPLVATDAGIRSYIGAPVSALSGAKLGTLCAMDRRPRGFGENERRLVADVAAMVENELLLRSMHICHPATGFYTTPSFNEVVDRCWRRTRSMGATSSLVLITVDRYLNRLRAWGKHGMNQALHALAQCVRECCDLPDRVIGHLNDDRLAIFTSYCSEDDACALAERIRVMVEAQTGRGENDFGRDVTVSLGVATYRPGTDADRSVVDLHERAAQALRESKSTGGNRTTLSGSARSESRPEPRPESRPARSQALCPAV